MTDDQLRDAYAAHLRARADPAAGACASPEDLLALVRREGPEAHRLGVLDHVMGCARCRAEFDLLRAVEAAGQAAAAGETAAAGAATGDTGDAATVVRALRPPRAPMRGGRRWAGPIGLALAASVVLTIGVRQYQAREGGSRDGVAATDGAATDIERGAIRGATGGVVLVAPAAGAVAPGVPLRFVWRAVPRATRYEVEVLATDGTVAFSGATADTVLELTDARRLALGVTYQWWVRAVGDAGGAPRQSALRKLRVTPR